jgi:hypothetical protein
MNGKRIPVQLQGAEAHGLIELQGSEAHSQTEELVLARASPGQLKIKPHVLTRTTIR